MSGPLYFEDVHEGDALPPFEHAPDMLQVVKWSGATWSFAPFFFDRDLARQNGLPDTIIPGPLKLALFAVVLQRWAGPEARVRALRMAYRRPDPPGRPLRFQALVTRTGIEEERGVVELDLWVENVHGERTMSGSAVLHLPRREIIAKSG